MSKRFPLVQTTSFVSKKPKLDVSIGRRDAIGTSSAKQRIQVRPPSHCASASLFDDADDDVILLASQNVEAENTREQLTQQVVIEESYTEISFNKFTNAIHTSTQVLSKPRDKVEPSKSAVNDAFDNIEKYFEDEIQMNEIVPFANFKLPKQVDKNPFKIPAKNNIDNEKTNKERESLVSQIKYLTEKIDAYKEQVEKLTKGASEFNERIQTKEGEVSMVRYQLRKIQEQNDNLRLEKMQEIDNIKKEWQEKISELEKLLRSQQDELEFKNVEIVNLKSSRMNESQRSIDLMDSKKDFKKVAFFNNLHLELGEILSQKTQLVKIPAELFETKESSDGNLRFRDAVFKKELNNLQSCLAQMTISQTTDSILNERMILSLRNTIKVLLNYAQKLEFMKYTDTNANVEHKFLCEEPMDGPNCLIHQVEMSVFQESKLHPAEKAEIPRRLIAAFAVACKYSTDLCRNLETQRLGSSKLLCVLVDILSLLGFSKELYSHFGMLESLACLLLSFIENSSESEANAKMIVQYIRGLVFCRLGFRPLVKMSECLLRIVLKDNYNNTIVNSLCTESPVGSFVFNEYYKIFQFSPCSCILQVYAALLETAFPQDINFSCSQIKWLLQICRNHVTFLRICFERNVNWIVSPECSRKSCDCYAKAANSSVILMHLVLKEWISDPKRMDIRIVASISRDGVLLLYDCYHKNYLRDVLQNGGSPVKHRLQMIHNWLSDYKTAFQFKSAHAYALQSIMLSYIIADPIHMDETTTSKSVHPEDSIWCEIFESFV